MIFPENAHGSFTMLLRGSSMKPFFKPGDLLTVATISAKHIKPGQVIVYTALNGAGETTDNENRICHRVIAITNKADGIYFITKGDNLSYLDLPVAPDRILGRVAGVFYGKGRRRSITRLEELAGQFISEPFRKWKKLMLILFKWLTSVPYTFYLFRPYLKIVDVQGLKLITLKNKIIARRSENGQLLWIHPLFVKNSHFCGLLKRY